MKKLLVLLLCMPIYLMAQTDSGVAFTIDLSWKQVLEKAKTENKYIFVDVYATWCGPCKMMDKDVYTHPGIGKFINEKFISVKVQIDSTADDNEQVRAWYTDAHSLQKAYNITRLPALLFFAPDGKLLHKDFGFRNTGDFVRLIELALDPSRPLLYEQLEAYKKGVKDYSTMGNLALFVKNMLGDRTKAEVIAKDYKAYLDKQPVDTIRQKKNLDFIGQFSSLINTKDAFFKLLYSEADTVDNIMQRKGWADFYVNLAITRKELESKLVKDGKPLLQKPDWNKLGNNIMNNYNKVDAQKLLLDYQVMYYEQIDKDWKKWAFYVDRKIVAYPPNPGIESFLELNMRAWNTFLHCNDKDILTKALEWSNLSIKINPPENVIQELDTRANLLYKLGKVREAIQQEEAAVKLGENIMQKQATKNSNFIQDYVETLNKMRNGESTWPVK